MAARRKATKEEPWEHEAPARRGGGTKLSSGQKKRARSRARAAGRSYPNLVDNMRAASEGKSGGARKAAKKFSAKKSTAKKSAAKKSAAKKSAAKRSTAKKSTAKKSPAKRSPAKRSAAKTSTARRGSTGRRDGATRSPRTRARSTRTSPKRSTPRRGATRDPRGGLTAAGRAKFLREEGAHLRPGVKKAERAMSPTEMRRKGSWASRFYGRAELPALLDEHGEPTRFAPSAAAWGEPVPRTVAAARRIAAKGRRLLEKARRAR